jgi:hypothetical protein
LAGKFPTWFSFGTMQFFVMGSAADDMGSSQLTSVPLRDEHW